MRACVVIAFAAALGACQPDQALDRAPRGDVDVYLTRVDRIVSEKCATLDCHGDPGQPLRLYSEIGLRRCGFEGDPSCLGARDAGLFSEEIEANVQALVGVEPRPRTLDEALVLSKPLVGGVDHVGGDIFVTDADPEYQVLRDWLGRALGFIR